MKSLSFSKNPKFFQITLFFLLLISFVEVQEILNITRSKPIHHKGRNIKKNTYIENVYRRKLIKSHQIKHTNEVKKFNNDSPNNKSDDLQTRLNRNISTLIAIISLGIGFLLAAIFLMATMIYNKKFVREITLASIQIVRSFQCIR
jgi:hypothetical protein